MPLLSYPTTDFVPFTKILSADVNGKFNAIKTLLNVTGLDDTNLANAGITRATKLKAGTAGYVVINDGSTGTMSEEAQLAPSRGGLGFSPTISGATAGQVIGVNDAGNALALRSGDSSSLIESLHNVVTGIFAGETLTVNDAVCLDLNEGVYKVFKADGDDPTRNENFLGFALAGATVTPQISTSTISPTAWTSGTATITVNGRSYSQVFSTNHNTSVDALAALINADQDVNSCVASGGTRNLLTFTSKGARTLTIVITTNPTGATFAAAVQTQAPLGSNVRIQCFGPLTGFSGLTVGELYYLSATPGAITITPPAGAVFVGQAISSTVLFINPNRFRYTFGSTQIFVRSHGLSSSSFSNNVQDVELYNLSAWSSGPAATSGASSLASNADSSYGGFHNVIDGLNSSSNVQALFAKFNKAAWSTATTKGTNTNGHGCAGYNGYLYSNKGSTSSLPASATTASYRWNGVAWATANPFIIAGHLYVTCFKVNSLMNVLIGENSSGSIVNYHETKNSSDTVSSATVLPTTGESGGANQGANGIVLSPVGTTASYSWSGAAWASVTSAIACGDSYRIGASGALATKNLLIQNGGSTSGTLYASTQTYNGSAFSSVTASANARSCSSGAAV